MKDKWTELTREVESFLKDTKEDPNVVETNLPPDLHENIWSRIHMREWEQAREKLSDEDKELLRLGRLYRKKRRTRKYVVLAAAVVAMLALGITSVGGPEKIFGTVDWMLGGRKQMNVDSDNENVVQPDDLAEEEVYQQIEDTFGFLPVKLDYLPEKVGFLEAEVSEEVQLIHIVYGKKGQVNISYQIRPNFQQSSWGKDVEDTLLEEFDMLVRDSRIQVRKYLVEEKEEIRWMIGFEHDSVSYSMMLMHMEQEDVEKIVENLYFY